MPPSQLRHRHPPLCRRRRYRHCFHVRFTHSHRRVLPTKNFKTKTIVTTDYSVSWCVNTTRGCTARSAAVGAREHFPTYLRVTWFKLCFRLTRQSKTLTQTRSTFDWQIRWVFPQLRLSHYFELVAFLQRRRFQRWLGRTTQRARSLRVRLRLSPIRRRPAPS